MRIRHGRIHLALHTLARRDGPTLLVLHALYGSSQDAGDIARQWPGSVYALDFSGHGQSEPLLGGGYTPELLAADADTALACIGKASVLGSGLGAYVALLLAGSRPKLVPAALLVPGPGLHGAGPAPRHEILRHPDEPQPQEPLGGHDAYVRLLERDVRPPDYAGAFAVAARHLLLMEDDPSLPPWWQAVRSSPHAHVIPGPLDLALEYLIAASGAGNRIGGSP
jgi:pimeloyl-ACP methyl ester carboxylesterase